MRRIVFVNNQAPALNQTNLNALQDNIEEAIEEKQDVIESGTSLPATGEEGQIFLLYSEE